MSRQADSSPSLEVKIMGKAYHFACPQDERDELTESALYLDQKMREIRENGSVLGADKIAVMAALNLAHELSQVRNSTQLQSEDQQNQLNRIRDKIDLALASAEK